MPAVTKTLRTCRNGHRYYKSSDCPTCPVCEKERAPKNSFLSLLSAPARRALENEGIITLARLSTYRQSEILALHGIGKTTIPVLEKALAEKGLSFNNQ
jgi:DNA-directed RNA polymerase alpha subunit